MAPPIRAYLRQRSDTIRCIVSMLTEDPADGSESLLEEVAPEEAPFSSEAGGDEAALKALRQLGAQPGGQQGGLPGGQAPLAGGGGGAAAGGAAGADIVKLLIGIYGSKELFVDEYKRMLAGRLLARSDYECEREIRTLELLKLRWGGQGRRWHGCWHVGGRPVRDGSHAAAGPKPACMGLCAGAVQLPQAPQALGRHGMQQFQRPRPA